MMAVTAGPDIEEVFKRLEPVLLTYAYRLVRNLEDARDLVQDAFVRIHREPAAVSNPRAWLYRVVHNLAVNHLRSAAYRKEAAHQWSLRSTGPDDSELISLERIVHELPEAQRQAVILKYFQRLSYDEVAEILGCPVGTVKSHVWRGLRRIRETIGESEGPK
jgi:RNA polymerase sigma-70 factor (ECF subfamily)